MAERNISGGHGAKDLRNSGSDGCLSQCHIIARKPGGLPCQNDRFEMLPSLSPISITLSVGCSAIAEIHASLVAGCSVTCNVSA